MPQPVLSLPTKQAFSLFVAVEVRENESSLKRVRRKTIAASRWVDSSIAKPSGFVVGYGVLFSVAKRCLTVFNRVGNAPREARGRTLKRGALPTRLNMESEGRILTTFHRSSDWEVLS